jgi:hypothetical protein
MPTILTGANVNTSLWLLTLLVVTHHLSETVLFKIGPQATLAYLGILGRW